MLLFKWECIYFFESWFLLDRYCLYFVWFFLSRNGDYPKSKNFLLLNSANLKRNLDCKNAPSRKCLEKFRPISIKGRVSFSSTVEQLKRQTYLIKKSNSRLCIMLKSQSVVSLVFWWPHRKITSPNKKLCKKLSMFCHTYHSAKSHFNPIYMGFVSVFPTWMEQRFSLDSVE